MTDLKTPSRGCGGSPPAHATAGKAKRFSALVPRRCGFATLSTAVPSRKRGRWRLRAARRHAPQPTVAAARTVTRSLPHGAGVDAGRQPPPLAGGDAA